MTPLAAAYFDGRSSRRQSVTLQLATDHADQLLVQGEGWQRHEALANLRISEPQGRAPRTLRLPDGAYCEVPQSPAFEALLASLGYQESSTVRLQSRWSWTLVALLSVVLLLGAAYTWGLPWAARVSAPLIPVSALNQVSRYTLESLDKQLLQPSKLAPARRQALEAGFQQLAAADPELAPFRTGLKLHFRRAPQIGPNAFALPDGQIVLFDELVEMPADDAEILAVLAHELGHVRQRHGLRQLIQSSVVAAFTAAYLGDVSSLAAGLSTLVLSSGYSRDMEQEADDYAASTLRRQGQSPAALASALAKLEKAHAGPKEGWLSSHPDTEARIRRLSGN